MLIYNVTTKVDWSVSDDWVKWMQEIHLPDVMASGCFEKYQFVRLLDIDEVDGPTYAAQFYASSKDSYDDYISNHAPQKRQHVIETWGNKFISFRTLMQLINEQLL